MKFVWFLFCVSVWCLKIPDDLIDLTIQRQWVKSNKHALHACVAIDSQVRYYNDDLIVNIVGFCDDFFRNEPVYCEISSFYGSVERQNATVFRAPPNETRGGYRSPLFLAPSQFGDVLMWNAIYVNCGSVGPEFGTVTIVSGETRIENVVFEALPTDSEPTVTSAICTRLYNINQWKPANTIRLLEWIEWNLAIGIDVIHVYLHSVRSDQLWEVLRAYIDANKIVLHDWSNDAVMHGWELSQVSHITDCLLRLEGNVKYITHMDHDEYIQLSSNFTNISEALSHIIAKEKVLSNVLRVDPLMVKAQACSKTVEEPHVASYCSGCEYSYFSWSKYFFVSDRDQPLQLMPYIHTASGGRAPYNVSRDYAFLAHIKGSLERNAECSNPIYIQWDSETALKTWKSLTTRPIVEELYKSSEIRTI